MDPPSGRLRGLDEPRQEVRAGDAFLNRHAEERSAPHHRHPVGEAHVGLLQDVAELGLIECVHEEVDVRGRDLMRATERAAVLDQLADQGDRLVHAEIGDGDAEEQRRRSNHSAVSTLRSVRVQSTARSGRIAFAQSATFHAATFGADSSAL